MLLRASLLALLLAVLSPVAPVRAADAADDPAGSALLDDIPNYGQAIVGQWRGRDLTPAIEAMLADSSSYGRLRPTQARPLSLSDCIALALANNTGLQVARLGPLGARAQVRSAESVFDPGFFSELYDSHSVRPAGSALQGASTARQNDFDVSVGVQKYLRTGGQMSLAWVTSRLSSNNSFISLSPQYTSDLLLSLNQPLLRNFGRSFSTLQVRLARSAEESSRKQYEASLNSLVHQVESAYWLVVGTREFVGAQEQGVIAARELLRQNEGKFSVGTVPRTAVLEAQAELARRDADLIQARNAASIAEDGLRAVINAPSEDASLLVNIDPSDKPTVEPYTIDLEKSLALALDSRPELAAARLALEQGGMQLRIAENQLLPRLDASGSIGTNGLAGDERNLDPNSFPGLAGGSNFTGNVDDSWKLLGDGRFYTYSMGLVLEVPLDNAKARANYSATRVGLDSARLDLRQLQENITLEIKRAATNLETDSKSIEARRLARELAEENVRNQQARYDVGLATTKDLLDFQDQLTQARAAEITAMTKYRIDLSELRRVEGSLLETHKIDLELASAEETPWWAKF